MSVSVSVSVSVSDEKIRGGESLPRRNTQTTSPHNQAEQRRKRNEKKEQEANNFLEKRYKENPNPALSYDDTVQLALACLQNVLGSDLKADDVEACVVRNGELKFTKLTADQIEAHLTALAERDDDVAAATA